jgi:geranylgeranyl pyrophosphate synthase
VETSRLPSSDGPAIFSWLGGAPDPLAAILAQRVRLFHASAESGDWPVAVLPELIGSLYGLADERVDALRSGCALFYLAADVVDDAQDGELPASVDWRHGVNAGNALLFGAIGAFGEAAASYCVAPEVSAWGMRLTAGQALDLATTWDGPLAEHDVITMARLKAGASMALFCRLGARSAGLGDPDVDAWGRLGEAWGAAMQLRNDLRGLQRPGCADLRERRATFPLVHARKFGADLNAARTESDGEGILEWLDKTGARAATEAAIEHLIGEAFGAIEDLTLDRWQRTSVKDRVVASCADSSAL